MRNRSGTRFGVLVVALGLIVVQAPPTTAVEVLPPNFMTLAPDTPTEQVGIEVQMTAAVLDRLGTGVADQPVTLTVAGANAGAKGLCIPMTCESGSAGSLFFTYTGANVGIDTVKACVTGVAPPMCATAEVTWTTRVELSINDVAVVEGDSGTKAAVFTVTLNTPAPVTGLSYSVVTATRTANANVDFDFVGARHILLPGETSRTVSVPIYGDLEDEPDETYVVEILNPSNAAIGDGVGLGTIIDDERDGAFSCRASALRVMGVEPVVANLQNSPCVDVTRTALPPSQTAGMTTVGTGTLTASTDQSPDVLEPTAPSGADRAVAVATAQGVTVASLGLINLKVASVRSEARVQCTLVAGVLTPRFTGSSSVTGLTLNGLPLNAIGTLPLGLGGSIQMNRTVTSATSITQQALRINLLGIDIVIGEARANFSGNPCSE